MSKGMSCNSAKRRLVAGLRPCPTNRRNMYTPRPKDCSVVFINHTYRPYHDKFVAETSGILFGEIKHEMTPMSL